MTKPPLIMRSEKCATRSFLTISTPPFLQALMNMDTKPTEGFEKLQFLLQQNPFPPETFGNLLLLYCKYEYYDLAADVLAENAHLTYK